MKLRQLNESLFTAFKLISLVGFIITGALTISMLYERLYKKRILGDDKEKVEKYKWFFYLGAAIVEAAFIYLYILLFEKSPYTTYKL